MNKIVYLGMIGDIMHPGLINIINEGAKYGDVMIGLFTDKAIATHQRLPYMTYDQRKNVIENIKGVSQIVPQDEWSYVPNLLKYRPDYIIHGDDWCEGADSELRQQVFETMKQIGGEVIEIPYTKGINSSSLDKEIKKIGTTPDIRLKTLRRLIAAKPIVRILEVHDGLSGLIVENLETERGNSKVSFDGMWSSSLTDSTSKGKPDIEAVDLTTRMQDLNNILECTTKPIIYDGDTGGKPEHFVFTVRTLERNGISAVIIEDKIGLKKNSLFGTEAIQTQDSIEGFCNKIRMGKEAQVTKDFMIIARCESLIAGKTVEDALQRCLAYVDAGADGIILKTGELLTRGDVNAVMEGKTLVFNEPILEKIVERFKQAVSGQLAKQEAVVNYEIDEYDERFLRHLALGYTKEQITGLRGMPFGVKSLEKRQNDLIRKLFSDAEGSVNATRLVVRAIELRIIDIDNLVPDED